MIWRFGNDQLTPWEEEKKKKKTWLKTPNKLVTDFAIEKFECHPKKKKKVNVFVYLERKTENNPSKMNVECFSFMYIKASTNKGIIYKSQW